MARRISTILCSARGRFTIFVRRVDVEGEQRELFGGLAAHAPSVDKAQPGAEHRVREDVLRHGEVLEDGELLVHHRDADGGRVQGVATSISLPVEDQLARVGPKSRP